MPRIDVLAFAETGWAYRNLQETLAGVAVEVDELFLDESPVRRFFVDGDYGRRVVIATPGFDFPDMPGALENRLGTAEELVAKLSPELLALTGVSTRSGAADMYAYVRLPPVQATANLARRKLTMEQMDFADVVDMSELPDADKVRWKAEPPDPALRD